MEAPDAVVNHSDQATTFEAVKAIAGYLWKALHPVPPRGLAFFSFCVVLIEEASPLFLREVRRSRPLATVYDGGTAVAVRRRVPPGVGCAEYLLRDAAAVRQD